MSKIAIYPGTFDPITLGHIDIIKKSLKIVDKLIVATTDSSEKDYFFSLEDRNYKISPCRSRAENVLNLQTLLQTLFSKPLEIRGFRPYTETQKSHRQGGAIVPPCLF